MWVCSNCGEKNREGHRCRCCGSDETKDYKKYMLPFVLPEHVRREWRIDSLSRGIHLLQEDPHGENGITARRIFEKEGAGNTAQAAQALYFLGLCLQWGIGGDADDKKALDCYMRAAVLGETRGAAAAGESFFNGELKARNWQESVKWYRLGAAGGNAFCRYRLGMCLEQGLGTGKDEAEAKRLYRLAAMEGVSDARRCYERMESKKCRNSENILMEAGENGVFGKEILRKNVVAVTFLSELSQMNNTAWDVSQKQDGSVMAWIRQAEEGLELFIGAPGGVVANESCENLFSGYEQVKKINFGRCFDTSCVRTMRKMFHCCRSLVELNLDYLITANVTDMNQMFYGCSSLRHLNLDHFDTSNVTNMGSMFHDCFGLRELNLDCFDTSRVEKMDSMFYGCSGLFQLNLNRFDTSNVTNMSWMFSHCGSLRQLKLDHFDTSNVMYMSWMFGGCRVLRQLNLKHFDTSKVISMFGMFGDCRGLRQLNVEGFVTFRVKNMRRMFWDCRSLTELDLDHFDISNVEEIGGMFEGCESLKKLKLGHRQITELYKDHQSDQMFAKCDNLEEIKSI